jgi:Cu(I)/Ag(I) efflux system periplasmic protein CusF
LNTDWHWPQPVHHVQEEQYMTKIATLFTALALIFAAHGAIAQSSLIDGQIVKVDQSAGKITIKHGPAKKLGMDEGMTMVYRAQDPAMLTKVKSGDKVKFDADQVNGQFTVTKIEKAK